MADVEKAQSSSVYPGQFNNGAVSTHRQHRVANPGVLGLFSFASTTFILSMYNVQTRGVKVANVVVGMAVFCGGLAQVLAGMWEFCRMNTFAATAFTSFGAFWMSYATILIPGSGIIDAYAKEPTKELANALGIYLITWFMVTVLFLIASLRKSIAFIALFACLAVAFALLAAGEWSGKVNVTKAGGGFGIITALIAYYVGLSELLASEEAAVFKLPIGVIKND